MNNRIRDEEIELLRLKHKEYIRKSIISSLITILSLLSTFIYTILKYLKLTYGIVYIDDYLSLLIGIIGLCLPVLLSFFSSASNALNNKITLELFLENYDNHADRGDIMDYYNDAIKLIMPLDRIKYKKLNKQHISIHDNRVLFRDKFHKLSLTLMIVTAIIMLVGYDSNLPQVVAVQAMLSYVVMLIDFFYYIYIVKKAGINAFSEYHCKFIKLEKPSKREDFLFMQQIFYMRHDRYSNYIVSTNIASKGFQYLGMFLTFISEQIPDYISKWFCIDTSWLFISLILSLASLGIFVYSLIFSSIWIRQQKIISYYLGVKYSNELYKRMKRKFNFIYDNRFKKSKYLFSRKKLEYSRGAYDYNIAVLDYNKLLDKQNISKDNNYRFISRQHVFTIRNRFINNVPRIRLTALVVFLVTFSLLIWQPMSFMKLGSVLTITIVTFFITLLAVWMFDFYMFKTTYFR